MNTDTMQLLSALLALFAVGGSLVLLVARFTSQRSAASSNFVEAFRPVALPLAFMVPAFAMFGSLWFSEAANYNPCKLCWYQRACMYPLAVILLVALLRKNKVAARQEVTVYAVPLAVVGSVISLYHYLLEWNPTWETNVCAIRRSVHHHMVPSFWFCVVTIYGAVWFCQCCHFALCDLHKK